MSFAEKLNIVVTPDQKIWLDTVYQRTKSKEEIRVRILKSLLYKRLPEDFNPDKIDSRLLRYGTEITLIGIDYLDPEFNIFDKTNQIISAIKECILNQPEDESLEISKVQEITNLDGSDLTLILEGLRFYGSFYNGSSSSENQLSSIRIGDESFDLFLRIKSIESHIDQKLKDEEKEKDKPVVRKGRSVRIGKKSLRRIGISSPLYYSEELDNYEDQSEDDSSFRFNPIFSSVISNVNKKLCFVLMPFGKSWSDSVYAKIKQSVENLGIQVLRADNLSGQIIIEDIWTQINLAAFVIVEMTDRNPNVMYELGIVHTIGKPALLITQEIENIPFDLRHHRHHVYENTISGSEKLVKTLSDLIPKIYEENYPEISL